MALILLDLMDDEGVLHDDLDLQSIAVSTRACALSTRYVERPPQNRTRYNYFFTTKFNTLSNNEFRALLVMGLLKL